MFYGTEGTQALFTGLATQIIHGGCDHDTADFYSKASGTTTADANPDPQIGNCTIFARFIEPAFATQAILTARLTRLNEREDWHIRFANSKNEEPLLLERGVSLNVQPTFTQPEPPKPPRKGNADTFAEAPKQRENYAPVKTSRIT